jgi:hypothetical protein
VLASLALMALASAVAIAFFHAHGWLLYYGDAEAHLNIARRILDSHTPGYDQLGTPWLPVPHLLMLPFVANDALWRNGLAGAIPSGFCFVAAGVFLFLAVRRIFGDHAPAFAAAAAFALNPNVLYLGSIPMSEAAFWAAWMALLYATARYRDTAGWGAVAAAGAAASLGALSRYEGWFLIPFVALFFARRNFRAGVVFGALASLGPLYWLGHNWWLQGDALYFLRGPGSAFAIQGDAPYPGKGDWWAALYYFRHAAALGAGPVLALAGVIGVAAALARRAFWPLLLLALPGVFYVWSMHSSRTPIFIPTLWPHSYYNSRYGLAAVPLLAFGVAALVAVVPRAARAWCAVGLVFACATPWLIAPRPANWATWQESLVNSAARREWTRQAAEFLAVHYVRGSGIITSSGDITGIYREAGIPLRETFSGDNGFAWLAAMKRPDLFWWHEWAVAVFGDDLDASVRDAARFGIRYRLEKRILVNGAPAIEIYRRTGGIHGTS